MKYSIVMQNKNRFCILLLLLFLSIEVFAFKKVVNLEYYGDIEKEGSTIVLQRAFNNIEGKCLKIPSGVFDISNINVTNKKNFIIEGSSNTILMCAQFTVKDCKNFEICNVKVLGTCNKFAYFNVIGDCSYFSLHNCIFDSEKDKNGNNTFYGIHIICDHNNSKKSFENSPRHFKIYHNHVRNTRFDGILIHALCSDFKIYKNEVDSSQCIGIEVEGRLGGISNTTVFNCRNASITNNNINNCGDWGILTMWVKKINIQKNICKNNFGCFLSIGCKNSLISDNYLEGKSKGFEISQEFYSLAKGINDSIFVIGNTIVGKARDLNRGVLDIRHAKNISVCDNIVKCLFLDDSSMLCISSSQNIYVKSNKFLSSEKKMQKKILYSETPDPETKKTSKLALYNINVNNNKFDVK